MGSVLGFLCLLIGFLRGMHGQGVYGKDIYLFINKCIIFYKGSTNRGRFTLFTDVNKKSARKSALDLVRDSQIQTHACTFQNTFDAVQYMLP